MGCVIVLATQYKNNNNAGDYNGISVGDSVETNIDYERHCSITKMIGKVIGFLTYGEEYPVAVLESGIEILYIGWNEGGHGTCSHSKRATGGKFKKGDGEK